MSKQNRVPDTEFRAGTIVGAVWSEVSVIDGRSVTQHSIRVEKRYRDDRDGEWKTTGYFRPDDLPKLSLVASKLFEHLVLRMDGAPAQRSADR
jgi:hypothetical protein